MSKFIKVCMKKKKKKSLGIFLRLHNNLFSSITQTENYAI